MRNQLETQLRELWPQVADRSDGRLAALLKDGAAILCVAQRMLTRSDVLFEGMEERHHTGSLELLQQRITKLKVRPHERPCTLTAHRLLCLRAPSAPNCPAFFDPSTPKTLSPFRRPSTSCRTGRFERCGGRSSVRATRLWCAQSAT